MPTVTLPDRNLAVAYEDRGSGLAVCLLHAFPMCRDLWRPQLDALSDSFRVLAPDLPGFGGTPAVDNVTIDAMAGVVADFLTAAGVPGPVVLGGLSMGGYVAFAFARRHPDRLRGLVLADTKPEADDAAAKANRDKQLAALADGSLTAAGLVEQMLPKLLGAETLARRPDVVNAVKAIGASQPIKGIAAAVKALRDRPDAVAGLGNIRVPTLVVVGEQDAVTPPDGAKRTADRIPGSRYVGIPGAGHLSNLEDPAAFNTALRDFLAGLAKA
jgi:pimeloyl-ACP methyl ester carboxylesterase